MEKTGKMFTVVAMNEQTVNLDPTAVALKPLMKPYSKYFEMDDSAKGLP